MSAQFLRGASGFGAVVFREKTSLAADNVDPGVGHADCLCVWESLGQWSWRDPDEGVEASEEVH
ncbi:MAG: hypothetical protein AAGA29_01090 [Planctomycetota bacterium]